MTGKLLFAFIWQAMMLLGVRVMAAPCQTVYPPVQFPDALGAHINSSFEWWWWLGVVNPVNDSDVKFGVLMMTTARRSCGTTLNETYVTVISVVDQALNKKYTQISFDIPDIRTQPYFFELDIATIYGIEGDNYQRMWFGADAFAMDIEMKLTKPDVGLNFPAESESAGASQPVLDLDKGTLIINNKEYTVEGQFRYEHQWYAVPTIGIHLHWLWSVFQLSNSYEGTVTLIFDSNGNVNPAMSSIYFVTPTNSFLSYNVTDLSAIFSDPWTSPNSNITYYQGLRFVIESENIDISFRTLIADNEFSINGNNPWYEGMSLITGVFLGEQVYGQGNIGIEPNS